MAPSLELPLGPLGDDSDDAVPVGGILEAGGRVVDDLELDLPPPEAGRHLVPDQHGVLPELVQRGIAPGLLEGDVAGDEGGAAEEVGGVDEGDGGGHGVGDDDDGGSRGLGPGRGFAPAGGGRRCGVALGALGILRTPPTAPVLLSSRGR